MVQAPIIRINRKFSEAELEQIADTFPFKIWEGSFELRCGSKGIPESDKEMDGYAAWCRERKVIPFSQQNWVYDHNLRVFVPPIGGDVYEIKKGRCKLDKELSAELMRAMFKGRKAHQVSVRTNERHFGKPEGFSEFYRLVKGELILRGYKIFELSFGFSVKPLAVLCFNESRSMAASLEQGIRVCYNEIGKPVDDEVVGYLQNFGETKIE